MTYDEATLELAIDGLDWTSPAVDICDTLVTAGLDVGLLATLVLGWLQ